ncbi:NUDIX hydrolase [Methylocystis echinoides]|uniref:NUDIX hydrolase n=1 Tax=Methylocystis echinoides TaxID=29468 RepID=UPI00343E1F1E
MTDEPSFLAIDRLDCRLVSHDWAFAREAAEPIARHWAARCAVNPTLYDGPVLLACRVAVETEAGSSALKLDAFETRFSHFLAWRDFGWPDATVHNCFAMPAVRSSDGAYLLGEMGPGHSAAGQRYFPAGTPDLDDVLPGGVVDLSGSLWRELAEETGLPAAEGVAAEGWTVIFDRQRVACIKRIDWPEPAEALRARVRAHLAAEAAPELCDAHLLAPGRHDDPRLPTFMSAFLARAAETG